MRGPVAVAEAVAQVAEAAAQVVEVGMAMGAAAVGAVGAAWAVRLMMIGGGEEEARVEEGGIVTVDQSLETNW